MTYLMVILPGPREDGDMGRVGMFDLIDMRTLVRMWCRQLRGERIDRFLAEAEREHGPVSEDALAEAALLFVHDRIER